MAEGGRPFVGRGEALDALHRRFDDLRRGQGGVTFLVGEYGVGKSALLAELVPEMRRAGVRVLVGRAPAGVEPPPFALLQSAVASAGDDPTITADADPRLAGDGVLVGFVGALEARPYETPRGIEGRLLDALGWSDPGGRVTADQVLTEIAGRLLEYTRHGPTVLVLEDLHRADPSSLAAVEFFVRELEGRPLWILATSPPGDALASSGRARLERFRATVRCEEVVLRGLNLQETAEFLRRRFPDLELSDETVQRRFDEAAGNPNLLEQLATRAGTSTRDPDRYRRRDLPIDEAERQVLDVAAVLGPEFPFAVLLGASEQDEERLAEEVDALVGRGLLSERPGELIEFPQDRLREEVYNYLSERRRRLLHLKAGHALESMGQYDASQVYALARHYYLGRGGAKAVQYNRIAAEIAERSLAPEAAWEHFSRALESQRQDSPEDLDGESELVLGLARITEELGVLTEAEEILREFLDRTAGDGRLSAARRAMLEVFLCRVLTDRGHAAEVAELAQKVLATPGIATMPLVRVGGHHHAGMALYYAGRYDEALAHHTEEIAAARLLDNPVVLARAQVWRIANLAMLGQTVDAIREAREVTAARDRFGSPRESAQAHLYLGDILADARSPPADRKDALDELAAAIRFAEQAKDPRRVGWALYKSTELLREWGRLDEASEKVELARTILGEMGDEVGLSVATKVRGQIAMDRGDLDRAARDLAEAQRLLGGTEHALEEIDVVLRLAQLALQRGDRDEANRRRASLETMELSRRRPDLEPEFRALTAALASA